ncbi:MAG: SGNH/GDSL hydrolase family protein [Planctomycetota bacterium]
MSNALNRASRPIGGSAVFTGVSWARCVNSGFATAAAGGLLLGVAGAAQAAPRVAGDPSVAQKFVDGNADLLILGDSINEIYMPPAYLKLAGFDVGAQLLNNNQSNLFNRGFDAFTYGTSAGPTGTTGLIYNAGDTTVDGILGVLPGGGWGATFGSGVIPASTNNFDNTVVEARITSPFNASNVYADTQSGGAFWLDDAPDGSFDLTLLTVVGPNGLPADTARVEVYQGGNLLGSAALPDQVRATEDAGLDAFTFTVPGGIDTSPNGRFTDLSVRVRLNDGVTINQGLNFTLAGMWTENGVDDTFGYASLARSGKTVDWFLDEQVLSDETLSTHFDAMDTDLVQIWLGENAWGTYDGTAWKGRIQQLIDKIRVADPDMSVALVSQYNTQDGNRPLRDRLADYAEVLAELALENENTVFLNLFDEAGDNALLNDQYLLDGVHPNDPGVAYFGERLGDLYLAATAVGDYDASGSVEQGDLNLVLNNWGLDTELAGVPDGWFLGLPNGAIDQEELNAVLNNWGGPTAPDLTALPEPTAAAALLGLLAAVRRRR